MKDKVQALYIGILAIIGTLTHFVFFGYPLSVVFDETYFLKFVGQYWNATYFFDVHPPLGKLLFVLFAWITGITPSAEIGTIHSPIDISLTYFRLLPMISGILLPIVVFYICRRLHLSHWTAFVAGVLVCIENSLLVQSRFVLIDQILILSGFVFLWWYLIYRDHKIAKRTYASWSFLILSAIAFACTISIKWNGLFFIVPAIVYELYDLWNWKRHHLSTTLLGACTRLVGKAILYTIVTISLYTVFFAVHFSLLTKSGPGDAFMTPQFQKTLAGSAYQNDNTLTSPGFFGKFFELNVQMFESHTQLTQPHNYSSRYYTWP